MSLKLTACCHKNLEKLTEVTQWRSWLIKGYFIGLTIIHFFAINNTALVILTVHTSCSAVSIQNSYWAYQIEHFEYRDFSVVESFYVYVFRYEGLGILGNLGFYTIWKPSINLKHTFNDNLCLKTISYPYIGTIEMFESENWKSTNQNRKIEIIEAVIRIEATQLTIRAVTSSYQISANWFGHRSIKFYW